jgi:hypothetical protein
MISIQILIKLPKKFIKILIEYELYIEDTNGKFPPHKVNFQQRHKQKREKLKRLQRILAPFFYKTRVVFHCSNMTMTTVVYAPYGAKMKLKTRRENR